MRPFADEKLILPDYPRTKHLPHHPNASRDDLVASQDDASIIFKNPNTYIEEKVDGANLGITWVGQEPLIRNRSHILKKGYRKETPAKMQFSSTWSWVYERREIFEKLHELAGNVSVYGEWLYATHSVEYTNLPSLFIAFDLFDHDEKHYIDPLKARSWLTLSGLHVAPLLHHGKVSSYQALEPLLTETSSFSKDHREGVYIKVSDGTKVTHRFKMVRPDFIPGEHWSDVTLRKNTIIKK